MLSFGTNFHHNARGRHIEEARPAPDQLSPAEGPRKRGLTIGLRGAI